MSLELPVVYHLKSAEKFGDHLPLKAVDFSDKTVVIPMISIVISVDNSGNTTKFYYWFSLVYHW